MPERPKIVYVDMDDTLCNYASGYLDATRRDPQLEFPQSAAGFFESLAPLPGALEAYQWLDSLPMVELYILTAPSIHNPLCYTEKRLWVEKHLGLDAVKRLIISPNKGLNKGDFLIDDYVDGKGQENFEGQLIQFGSQEFPDWQSVRSYFRTLFNV